MVLMRVLYPGVCSQASLLVLPPTSPPYVHPTLQSPGFPVSPVLLSLRPSFSVLSSTSCTVLLLLIQSHPNELKPVISFEFNPMDIQKKIMKQLIHF